MIVAIDFDDTIVESSGRAYDDVLSPLRLIDGAKEGLEALQRAGHTLILSSARANRSLLDNPDLDPLIRSGARRIDRDEWERRRTVNWSRYGHMVEFVMTYLPNIFDAIDDGQQGKVIADMYIDNRAFRFGRGALAASWAEIARTWGEISYGEPIGSRAS